MAFRPENSSSDQNPRFTSISEMTSISDRSHESTPSPPHTPFHIGVSPQPTHTHTHTHLFTWGSPHIHVPRKGEGHNDSTRNIPFSFVVCWILLGFDCAQIGREKLKFKVENRVCLQSSCRHELCTLVFMLAKRSSVMEFRVISPGPEVPLN